jgi:hypothetical protein
MLRPAAGFQSRRTCGPSHERAPVSAASPLSPELVLVDPELAAVLRPVARAGPSFAEPPRVAAPSTSERASPVRRRTIGALAGLVALLALQETTATEHVNEPVPVISRALPPIPPGRTDAAPRPLPHAARPPHRRPPPVIAWRAVRGAAYYDLVLWREGRRVRDLWPRTPQLALVSLAPGRYLWFAYPGFGPRSAGRFGPLAGSGSVVVRAGKNR